MKKYFDSKVFQAGLTALLVICIGILFYFFISNIGVVFNAVGYILHILKPLIIGLILAYIMRPIVHLFEKHIFTNFKEKTRRYLSIGCTLLVIIAILAALISIIIPQLLLSFQSLIVSIPAYIKDIGDYIREWVVNSNLKESVLSNYDTISRIITDAINNSLLPSTNNAIASLSSGIIDVISFVFNLLVGTVFAVYILANTENTAKGTKKFLYSLFNDEKVDAFITEVKHIDKIFTNFLVGKVCDSFGFVFVCCFLFLLIFGYPYPLLIAVIIGLTDLIPYFGPYIGTIPSALLIFLVSPVKAITFIIFIICLQQIDGNLITPRIQKSATGLPSFWVLFAITLFGGLFGVVGMIIGVPCFTIIYEIINDIINARVKKKNHPELVTEEKQTKRKFFSKKNV